MHLRKKAEKIVARGAYWWAWLVELHDGEGVLVIDGGDAVTKEEAEDLCRQVVERLRDVCEEWLK
jgi:creatinine amidohydrolase/Fe(II)-dependent formamide hydrolase-like protein